MGKLIVLNDAVRQRFAAGRTAQKKLQTAEAAAAFMRGKRRAGPASRLFQFPDQIFDQQLLFQLFRRRVTGDVHKFNVHHLLMGLIIWH